MQRVRISIAICAAAMLIAAAFTPTVLADEDVDGSYKLVQRVLPDGKKLRAPDVVGFITFMDGYRNFNVSWLDEKGERASIAMVAEYRAVRGEYCERVLYWMQNNVNEPGVSYTPPLEKKNCSKMKESEKTGHPTFEVNGEEVVLEFNDEGFTATAEGKFVDHWERID